MTIKMGMSQVPTQKMEQHREPTPLERANMLIGHYLSVKNGFLAGTLDDAKAAVDNALAELKSKKLVSVQQLQEVTARFLKAQKEEASRN
ncbi:MAG: hypothetical protein LBR41_00490 [Rickettsiales bacterium]|nr:hypothetical protein [Rickettsiales bacterium]